ncbi:MAG TPA: DUF4398 domain-containing protein [Burkholderiaceae bacterium]|jgi:hypothetical protein
MKKHYLTTALPAIAALLSACSSVPTNTVLLDQTRSEYIAAQSNPKVATYAPIEMKEASKVYAQANAASDHGDSPEKVDKLAYLAKQKIMLAQEIAKQKSTDADFATTSKDRNNMHTQ